MKSFSTLDCLPFQGFKFERILSFEMSACEPGAVSERHSCQNSAFPASNNPFQKSKA